MDTTLIIKFSKKIIKNLLYFYFQFDSWILNRFFLSNNKNVFIVSSHAKSGRTWVRFFISNYLNYKFSFSEDINWNNFNKITISTRLKDYFNRIKLEQDKIFIFSHGEQVINFFKDRKVIFITRNFYDIIISSYYHNKRSLKKFKDISLNSYINDYFDYENSIKYINKTFKNLDNSKKYIILSYEDLVTNTFENFKKIIKFLEIDFDYKTFEKTIDITSFSNMKAQELEGKKSEYGHVRKGEIYNYKKTLSNIEIETINKKFYNKIDKSILKYFI